VARQWLVSAISHLHGWDAQVGDIHRFVFREAKWRREQGQQQRRHAATSGRQQANMFVPICRSDNQPIFSRYVSATGSSSLTQDCTPPLEKDNHHF
jgi:hypothetical protein